MVFAVFTPMRQRDINAFVVGQVRDFVQTGCVTAFSHIVTTCCLRGDITSKTLRFQYRPFLVSLCIPEDDRTSGKARWTQQHLVCHNSTTPVMNPFSSSLLLKPLSMQKIASLSIGVVGAKNLSEN